MDVKGLNDLINPKEVHMTFILWPILLAASINFLTNIFSEKMGNVPSLVLSGSLSVIIIVATLINKKRDKKRIESLNKLKSFKIDSSISSKELKNKYKGLVAFVSNPPRGKTKDEWLNECKGKINSAIASQNISEVAGIQGIGQTFKAINHHLGELKYCWLLYTDQSDVNIDIIKYFIDSVTEKSLRPDFVKINDANDSKHIKETIDNIYHNLPEGVKVTDVIADITAGNKPMTAGMVLSCLDQERNIEYIEQSEKRVIIEVDISPKVRLEL